MNCKDDIKKGEALFRSGKLDDAKALFTRILEKQDDSHESLNNLGVIHLCTGKYREAEKYFLRALAIRKDYLDALWNLAMLYENTKWLRHAAIQFEKYTQLEPKSKDAFNNLGMVYFKIGDVEKAKKALTRSLKIDPNQQNIMGFLTTLEIENSALRTKNDKANIVIVASMARAGSMWVYNVTRELISASGNVPLPEEPPPDHDQLIMKALGRTCDVNKIYCFKTHSRISPSRRDARILCPYRDVRDAMLSFMRFMHCEFERGLRAAQGMMALTDYYFSLPTVNLLPIRYDDITSKPSEVTRKIARFLGLDIMPDDIKTILDGFSRKRVQKFINMLESIGTDECGSILPAQDKSGYTSVQNLDGSYRVFDKKTNFQSNHITSTSKGEWRQVLTDEQKRTLMEATSDWLVKYDLPLWGYSETLSPRHSDVK